METGNSDYEPDALVNCGERDDAVATPNPVRVVVEVLSQARPPTMLHCLIVFPTRRTVTLHRPTGGWIEMLVVFNGALTLDPPGIVLTIDEKHADAIPA